MAKLSKKEEQELRELFNLFDKDRSGSIDSEELGAVMRSFGLNPSNAEVDALLKEADEDKSGLVEFGEFVKAVSQHKENSKDPKEELKAAFKVFDVDGNGFISKEELAQVMLSKGEKLTPDELSEMIQQLDVNNDGQIDFDENVSC